MQVYPTEKGRGEQMTARITFDAPCAVRWSRHDAEGKTQFIASFYAVPTGSAHPCPYETVMGCPQLPCCCCLPPA